jgi:hypothetical protein
MALEKSEEKLEGKRQSPISIERCAANLQISAQVKAADMVCEHVMFVSALQLISFIE